MGGALSKSFNSQLLVLMEFKLAWLAAGSLLQGGASKRDKAGLLPKPFLIGSSSFTGSL